MRLIMSKIFFDSINLLLVVDCYCYILYFVTAYSLYYFLYPRLPDSTR